MFSTRCIAILALVAAAASLPAQEKPIPQPITTITNEELTPPVTSVMKDELIPPAPGPWFNVPFFGDITKIFAPLWKLFPTFEDLGPRIIADDDQFQVIVQVKDFKKSDLKVKVKGDYIFVQGAHEAKLQDDHDLFASQFFHTYSLPANSSGSNVKAELTSDGYLVISAPIDGPVDRSKETDREIPIVETGAPFKNDEIPELLSPEVAPVKPAASADDDRKEQTTVPPQKEDVTEKDNVIPHGNEVNEVSP